MSYLLQKALPVVPFLPNEHSGIFAWPIGVLGFWGFGVLVVLGWRHFTCVPPLIAIKYVNDWLSYHQKGWVYALVSPIYPPVGSF